MTTTQRTHYVTTNDGIAIGGAVHGQGPSIVFMQGLIGDGDLDWRLLVPHLADRFTCHLPSLRGRGLSGEHPDQSVGRHVEDMLAYVESIGEPVGLVGWSGGANHALGVAAQSDVVTSLVPFEPVEPMAMDEQVQATIGGAVGAMAALAADGKPADGVRAFAGFPFNDEEIAVADEAGYFAAAARYVPKMLAILQDLGEHGDPTAEPAVLSAVKVPVLVLCGSETKAVFATSARYVADQVKDGRIGEMPGAGHAAPLTHPEALANALVEFFA